MFCFVVLLFPVSFCLWRLVSPSVAQAGLELGIFLPLLLECWGPGPALPHSALSLVSLNLERSHVLLVICNLHLLKKHRQFKTKNSKSSFQVHRFLIDAPFPFWRLAPAVWSFCGHCASAMSVCPQWLLSDEVVRPVLPFVVSELAQGGCPKIL